MGNVVSSIPWENDYKDEVGLINDEQTHTKFLIKLVLTAPRKDLILQDIHHSYMYTAFYCGKHWI